MKAEAKKAWRSMTEINTNRIGWVTYAVMWMTISKWIGTTVTGWDVLAMVITWAGVLMAMWLLEFLLNLMVTTARQWNEGRKLLKAKQQ